jgi:xanthosine utilization system XapX-like protein
LNIARVILTAWKIPKLWSFTAGFMIGVFFELVYVQIHSVDITVLWKLVTVIVFGGIFGFIGGVIASNTVSFRER